MEGSKSDQFSPEIREKQPSKPVKDISHYPKKVQEKKIKKLLKKKSINSNSFKDTSEDSTGRSIDSYTIQSTNQLQADIVNSGNDTKQKNKKMKKANQIIKEREIDIQRDPIRWEEYNKTVEKAVYCHTSRNQRPPEISKEASPKIKISRSNQEKKWDAHHWLAVGTIAGEQNRWLEALTAFDNGIFIAPGNPRLWKCKALALFSLHKYDSALTCIDRSLSIDPTDSEARTLRKMIIEKK
jgi:tetratricopeptide (TPR) repeat protein